VGEELFLPNEIRLLRRLVRDRLFRNTPPEFTLQIWQSVRENEEKSIFPYVSKCHFEIDSTMPYGLGILKPHLERILETVPKGSPFLQIADRIRERIQCVQSVPNDLIGVNSLYKEFV
jgi:uridine kinase